MPETNDYISISVRFVDEEDRTPTTWVFDKDTAKPDLTAYELVQILRIVLTTDNKYMDEIRGDERLMRHFQMREKPE